MVPRGVSSWRRPYTSIYNDNYRYGTGLYSDTLSGIEKRYAESLSRTQLRSDRPDLTFTSFSGSQLTSSPTPVGDPGASPVPLTFKGSTFESRLNTALHSAYLSDAEEAPKPKPRKAETPRPVSLYDDASFWTLPKTTKSAELSEGSRGKKKIEGRSTPTNGPTTTVWKEKSHDLQSQVESLEKSMSDSSVRLKTELTSLKSRYQNEMSDLNSSVELSSQQANELSKTVKKQANQITALQSAYDEAQRNLQDTIDEMTTWQSRCKTLKKEMDRLKDELEQAKLKASSSSKE